MTRVTPRVRNFARRVAACAAREDQATGSSAPFHACDRLRSQLTILLGVNGVRALMSRALMLAGLEVEWLRTLRVTDDGALEGLAELDPQPPADTLARGSVTLLAHMLDLLIVFIGERMTLQLIGDAWPELSPNDSAASGDDR